MGLKYGSKEHAVKTVLPCVQRGLREIYNEVEGLSLSGTAERSITFLDLGDMVREH